MKRDIATKWTAALRSGDYGQCKEALQVHGNFCCLGVLCDLHRQEVGGEWHKALPGPTLPEGCQTYTAPNGDWDYALLPEQVQEWAGLRGSAPTLDGEGLTTRNDEGWSFGRLADLIEDRWEDL